MLAATQQTTVAEHQMFTLTNPLKTMVANKPAKIMVLKARAIQSKRQQEHKLPLTKLLNQFKQVMSPIELAATKSVALATIVFVPKVTMKFVVQPAMTVFVVAKATM